jgi:CRISPR-associated protein Cmr2
MFSSKWLAEDMNLDKASPDRNPEHSEVAKLRCAVDNAHKQSGFGDGSPSDWWVAVLADGDGMGEYISGSKLKQYQEYIDQTVVDPNIPGLDELYAERKRMGPATHVGLNRALLDFSNRLVPYLTEKRFCGKVI